MRRRTPEPERALRARSELPSLPNDRYDGEWKGGQREGRGTLRFTCGAVYEGDFRAGVPDGRGTCDRMASNQSPPRGSAANRRPLAVTSYATF